MLFDSHAHYDDERFDDDRFSIIRKVHQSGVTYILNASSNVASAIESISLAQEYEFVYAAVGVHPHHVGEINEHTFNFIADFATKPKVVAIGEIGLDYYYDTYPREEQKYWFARQINLARDLKLPVIVHDRDAHMDVMNIVKAEKAKEVGGVFHCYSGSVEMAKELLKLNFHISVGGSATFKKADRLAEVIRFIPLESLLIETDCPYMTPEPFRGQRNDSSYVRLVAEKIAEIKGTSFEEIAGITMQNAKRLFRIA